MNPSSPRSLLSGLTFVLLIAAGSCGTHSVIGQQTGQGGTSGPGTGGASGSGAGGLTNPGDTGGTPGTGGLFSGDGGSPAVDGGGRCPASAGSSGSGLSFSAAVEYFTHAGSTLVALADLNGDGKPDLAVADYMSHSNAGGAGGSGAGGSGTGGSGTGGSPGTSPGSVSVFLSSTAGYGPPQYYNLNTAPLSIVTGDLNGDGKADVAIVNAQGVSVLFNDGSGALLSPVSFATGTGPSGVALGDLNGDGKADLAVANQGTSNGGGDVAVLLNMGGGTFVAANYPAGASPTAVAIADLNGDGKADLALASGTGVSVLLNSGGGAFGSPASYGSGTNPYAIAAGDLNADGKLDLAVGSNAGASVLLNIGAGAFAAAVNYNYTAPYSAAGPMVIGDLNGDGRPDLAASTRSDDCTAVAVLLNQGSGVFGASSYVFAAAPSSSSFNFGSLTSGDLDGDGKLDLVVPNGDGVAVVLNTTP